MSDIAEQVAAWEHDTTVQALTSKQRQRVYIALYQSHLPKLKKVGIIEYNQNRGYVELLPAAQSVMPYLDEVGLQEGDASSEDEGPVAEPSESTTATIVTSYGAVTALSIALVGGVWAGLTALPTLALAGFITGLYALVTALVIGVTTASAGGIGLGE